MSRIATSRSLAALALTAAAVAVLAGCAGSPEAAPTSSAPTLAPSVPTPTTEPTQSATPQADPTCDTIIPQDVVDDFGNANWTSQPDVFRIGETEIPGGIQCTWGDADVASDHVQMFGWAPIDADTASQQQAALLQQGWFSENGPDGTTYITEDKSTALAPDEDGYGWTYQFGDGWVKFSDTKQGLLLVDWPPSN